MHLPSLGVVEQELPWRSVIFRAARQSTNQIAGSAQRAKPLETLAHAQKKHPSLATGKDVEGCSEGFGLSGDRRRLGRAGQCSSSGPAGS